MTDRELLELAAKAAGYSVRAVSGYEQGGTVSFYMEPSQLYWNPLTDDGDALRLAVKLQLHVGINPGNKVFCTPTYSDKPTVFESCERSGVQDPLAATRRAIVRAAAEIGRSME
jgi:hypothetical protein